MTYDIVIVLSITLAAVILFITDKVRIDLVALFVLVSLASTGIVTTEESISGFGNPVVITIWSMFIISASLTNTNVAAMIGKRMLRISGAKERNVLFLLMGTAGFMSVFMNNIGVSALLLPVAVTVSRKTGIPPSKLLMPMVFGSLLGGMTTLLTTVNLLVSNFLFQHDIKPFDLYDFFPVGIFAFTAGVCFVAFYGVKLLPSKDPVSDLSISKTDLKKEYALQEKTYILKLNKGSSLAGKDLEEIKLGSAVGLTVFGIVRNGETILAPGGSEVLKENDKLLVGGRLDRFKELQRWQSLLFFEDESGFEGIVSDEIKVVEVEIAKDSSLDDVAVSQSGLKEKYAVNILAIKYNYTVRRLNLPSAILHRGDKLLIQGKKSQLENVMNDTDFTGYYDIPREEVIEKYNLHEKIFSVGIHSDSELIGKTISESRLGSALGLRVLGILREGKIELMPSSEEKFLTDDVLIVEGEKIDMNVLKGLHDLEIVSEAAPELKKLESEKITFSEAVLSPRSRITGMTLRAVNFRKKYGLQVVGIWREGIAHVANLRDIELKLGDAILLLGSKENINLLSRDPDFILLTKVSEASVKAEKAPLSLGIVALMLVLILTGALPVSIAALGAAMLMILTRCLSMDEAYRAIDWKAVFLVAGMIPLGIAMQKTGAVDLFAKHISGLASFGGPWTVIILLYIISTITCSFIPSAALIVIMAPVALNLSESMGFSPYTIMMAIAVSANASFLSPVSHPANVMVMGPGGYKMKDYLKLGLPLTLIVMIVGLLMTAVFWPL